MRNLRIEAEAQRGRPHRWRPLASRSAPRLTAPRLPQASLRPQSIDAFPHFTHSEPVCRLGNFPTVRASSVQACSTGKIGTDSAAEGNPLCHGSLQRQTYSAPHMRSGLSELHKMTLSPGSVQTGTGSSNSVRSANQFPSPGLIRLAAANSPRVGLMRPCHRHRRTAQLLSHAASIRFSLFGRRIRCRCLSGRMVWPSTLHAHFGRVCTAVICADTV